jgi:hypothetical protein
MLSRLPRHFKKTVLICLLLFAVAFTAYWATGEGHPTYYNYYVRLADAFLNGRLYLTQNPSWLNELVPNPSGTGYYVVYPPLPAFLMTPIVAIFGLQTDQTLISLFVGSATVILAYIVAKDVSKKPENPENNNQSKYIWAAIMLGFGTIFWWLASTGSVWLIAQVFSVFFLLVAIHEAFNKARPLIMGLLVGASFWCRLPTILGIFFFAGLIISRQQTQNWKTKFHMSMPSLIKLAIGVGIFVAFDMAYNYVRFGTPFDVAYWMIPGILDEPWFNLGLFNLSYIPQNLTPFLTGLPTFTSTAPYMIAPLSGLAIWFTTPAFIFSLKSKIKDAATVPAWIAIFAIAFVIFTKGLSGWGFGYRYAVDFYPFLYVLTLQGISEKIRWYHKLLIVLGIIVNIWGTIAFNKYGY